MGPRSSSFSAMLRRWACTVRGLIDYPKMPSRPSGAAKQGLFPQAR